MICLKEFTHRFGLDYNACLYCSKHRTGDETMILSVAIIEDDISAARELERCLTGFGAQSGHTFSIFHYNDAVVFLSGYQSRYDIIFMDIKMPGIDGMSASEQLRRVDPVTMLIFVTSMVQYAVQGYDVSAFDFIVKPINPVAFTMKMRRAMCALKLNKGNELTLHVNGVTHVLSTSAIQYIEVMNHSLTYHTEQGVLSVRGKLTEAEQHLPEESFFRCSVSYLINLRYVTQFTGEQVCVAGEWLRVSRSKKKELAAAVAAFLGRGV